MTVFRFFLAITALWAVPNLAPADIADQVTDFTLENGLQVVVIEDHRAPVVVHMLWYRAGSSDEPAGVSGIAHFLEHLLFKQTKTLEAGEFSRVVAENGGSDNAFTSKDFTAYFQRVAADRLDLMMQMEADRMVNLDLDEEAGPDRISRTVQPPEMTWTQLIATRDGKRARGESAIEEGIEIQRKFVLAAAALILPLIGISLGIQRSRAVRARGFGVSILIILVYYFALSGVMTMVRRGALPLDLGMWIPNAALAIIGLALFIRTAQDGRFFPSARRKPAATRPGT